MKNTRRKYDTEFKRNAVLLTREKGRTIKDVAENLGISVDLLYQWRRRMSDLGGIAFPGNRVPALTPEKKHIRDLEKQLKNTAMERDIFKNPWPFSAEHSDHL